MNEGFPRRICNLYFLDSLLLFTWLAMFVSVVFSLAFPLIFSEGKNQLIGLAAFFFLTTGRFMANFDHQPLVEIPVVYGTVLAAFYFVLGHYTLEWWFAVGPTCIACACWPGIKWLWTQIKPVPVVSDREFMRERILRMRSQPL